MKPKARALAQAAALAAAFVFAAAAEQGASPLVSGPGVTLTLQKCQVCHEIGHITRARLSREQWADNLQLMRQRGAQIDDREFKIILDYLAAYYSRNPPPPPAADPYAASGAADPVAAVLQANACTGCHELERRTVGPSFREIAARYAADPQASEYLAKKIRSGGKGAWGEVPMPPTPAIAEADLARVVAWVLAQK